jgi:hypothetical protein
MLCVGLQRRVEKVLVRVPFRDYAFWCVDMLSCSLSYLAASFRFLFFFYVFCSRLLSEFNGEGTVLN